MLILSKFRTFGALCGKFWAIITFLKEKTTLIFITNDLLTLFKKSEKSDTTESKYSRVDQVKVKDCLPQILLGPLLNTLSRELLRNPNFRPI